MDWEYGEKVAFTPEAMVAERMPFAKPRAEQVHVTESYVSVPPRAHHHG